MDNKELLAVLKITSEVEQIEWLIEKGITDGSLARSQITNRIVPHWIRIELSELAFRLRDEVKYIHRCSFVKAVQLVYGHYFAKIPNDDTLWRWFSREAKPIHWIIATLIAKNHNQRKD